MKTPSIIKSALLGGAAALLITAAPPVLAQDTAAEAEGDYDVIITTGTRIQNPNVVASSPINVIGQDELNRKFTPNIERVFRDLPITIPGDGENVNNGTDGTATINLRGLGDERTLVLVDGKRLVPYDIDGVVDVNIIPLQMLERVDVITGGASAVYGSDAVAGAVNFILRQDFEGIEVDVGFSTTEEGGLSDSANGGNIWSANVLMGSNLADGRGNVTVGLNYTKREPVFMGDRDFGVFSVATATGAGLGASPAAPDANCTGNSDLTTAFSSGSGSTTAIPGTLNLRSGSNFQFRDDGTLGTDLCSRFNFNPFNLYQTPQERFAATTIANYEINDHIEAYARASFATTNVRFEIAPSGTFGQSFEIPVANPFFDAAARQLILDDLNAFVDTIAGTIPDDPTGFETAGIIDNNNNGIFDEGDSFLSTARRRTTELGPRTGAFESSQVQFVVGLRGDFGSWLDGWRYDVSYQHAESDWVESRDGFTDLEYFEDALNTVSLTECITPTGQVTDGCTPINPFGPQGSISPDVRDLAVAFANDIRNAQQAVFHASANGPLNAVKTPWADTPMQFAFGFEYRDESARSQPDECLQEPPSSCQGGAGGNRLPVFVEIDVREGFAETIWPLIENQPFFDNVTIEAGYRYSDYNLTGSANAWKAGISWAPVPSIRFRYMEQQAVRAPNFGELGSPITQGLDNANFDPCSVGNPNPIDDTLRQLCIQTGVPAALVGQVADIISGQINTFEGTDPTNLPEPETARTRTVGVVWQPDVGGGFQNVSLSVDYYDINITGFIDQLSGQESLDQCYVLQNADVCDRIVRIGGSFQISGSGVPQFFTNLEFFRAEGIEVGLNTSYDLGEWGGFDLVYNGNYYLTNESQSAATSTVTDCNGFYGTSCDPVPTYRHTVRGTWNFDFFDLSMLWRYVDGMEQEAVERTGTFPAFQSIDAFHYFDLSFGVQLNDNFRIGGIVKNITDRDPPIIGNETGSTSFNSGNTFPSLYDTLGRTYAVNATANF